MTPLERFLAAPVLELDVLTGAASRRYRLAVPGPYGYVGQTSFAEGVSGGLFDSAGNGVEGALFPYPGDFANRFSPLGADIDRHQDSDVPLIVLGLKASANEYALSAAGYLPPARFSFGSRAVVTTQGADIVASIEIELATFTRQQPGAPSAPPSPAPPSPMTPEFWAIVAEEALEQLDGASVRFGEPQGR